MIWTTFPQLSAIALRCSVPTPGADVEPYVTGWTDTARALLGDGTESDLAPIRAWRHAFATMGLRPTGHRCASEALLRRLRTRGGLPRVHPLVDLCNAASAASAIPIAVFDLDRIAGVLEVRHATGAETYATFAGDTENPDPDEVVYADSAQHAHSRRWCTRQSRTSAVGADTRDTLIVAEAMHDGAAADLDRLGEQLAAALAATTGARPESAVLTATSPGFVPSDRGDL